MRPFLVCERERLKPIAPTRGEAHQPQSNQHQCIGFGFGNWHVRAKDELVVFIQAIGILPHLFIKRRLIESEEWVNP